MSSRRVGAGIDCTESAREWTSRRGHPQLATPNDKALRAVLGAGVFALAAVSHGQAQPAAVKAPPSPGPFVAIVADGSITVQVNRLDFGRGVNISMPMLVAEEMDANWTRVRGVRAPAGARTPTRSSACR